MIVDQDRKVAFIFHPRTASTSLRTLLSCFEEYGTRHSIEPEIIKPDWTVGCVIRNPFDTLVSWYFVSRHTNFQEWLDSDDFKNHMWISKGLFFGLPYATHVLRFEHLQEDFDAFCDEVGWGNSLVPFLNAGKRRSRKSWREVVAGCTFPEIKIC